MIDGLERQIERLYQLRGFHDACEPCIFRLICLADRLDRYWCPKCSVYYIPHFKERLDCDALQAVTVTHQGLCPACDGGERDVPIRKGAKLFD